MIAFFSCWAVIFSAVGCAEADQEKFPVQHFDASVLDHSKRIGEFVQIARSIPSFQYLHLMSVAPATVRLDSEASWSLVNLMPCPLVDCTLEKVYSSLDKLSTLSDSDLGKVMNWIEFDASQYWYSANKNDLCGQPMNTSLRLRYLREIGRRGELICNYIYNADRCFPWVIVSGSIAPAPEAFLQEFHTMGGPFDPIYSFTNAMPHGRRKPSNKRPQSVLHQSRLDH